MAEIALVGVVAAAALGIGYWAYQKGCEAAVKEAAQARAAQKAPESAPA